MKRKNFIKDLQNLSAHLTAMSNKTKERLKESNNLLKLLKLEPTVHNKTRLNNYLKDGTK